MFYHGCREFMAIILAICKSGCLDKSVLSHETMPHSAWCVESRYRLAFVAYSVLNDKMLKFCFWLQHLLVLPIISIIMPVSVTDRNCTTDEQRLYYQCVIALVLSVFCCLKCSTGGGWSFLIAWPNSMRVVSISICRLTSIEFPL